MADEANCILKQFGRPDDDGLLHFDDFADYRQSGHPGTND